MKTKYKGKITYRIKELLRNKLNFISRFIFKSLDDQVFKLHCTNGLDGRYMIFDWYICFGLLRIIKYCTSLYIFDFLWWKMKKWSLEWFVWLKLDGFLCIFCTTKSTKQGKVWVLEDDTPKLISSCKTDSFLEN